MYRCNPDPQLAGVDVVLAADVLYNFEDSAVQALVDAIKGLVKPSEHPDDNTSQDGYATLIVADRSQGTAREKFKERLQGSFGTIDITEQTLQHIESNSSVVILQARIPKSS